MANYRDRRVGQEILKEVNAILRKKVRDPRVQDVTITDVHVTGDLQQATIYLQTTLKPLWHPNVTWSGRSSIPLVLSYGWEHRLTFAQRVRH